jgi:oxalate decarboxylase/phosphoglucose isomerase-like protein (cupin superfamily)
LCRAAEHPAAIAGLRGGSLTSGRRRKRHGNAAAARHQAHREEIIYVLEGSLKYQIEGQPTRTCNAGDALTVPAGAVHAVRNAGSGNAAELATYVVEKGKPVLTPVERAPAPPVTTALLG